MGLIYFDNIDGLFTSCLLVVSELDNTDVKEVIDLLQTFTVILVFEF